MEPFNREWLRAWPKENDKEKATSVEVAPVERCIGIGCLTSRITQACAERSGHVFNIAVSRACHSLASSCLFQWPMLILCVG